MDGNTVTVSRGGRVHEAIYAVSQGQVRVSSPWGWAEGPARADPEASACSLLNRILDLHEAAPSDDAP